MQKVEFALLGGAAIVLVILMLLVGALGVIGFLYLKSNPNSGSFNYSTYNGSTTVDVSATPTPTPSPTATPSPTPTPSPTATPSPTPTPSPTATPLPDNGLDCDVFNGVSEHGDKLCAGNFPDEVLRYVWQCQDGTWVMIETCTSASACSNGVCS